MYSIVANPDRQTYRALIDWAAAKADSLLLIVRDPSALSDRALHALQRLEPSLRRMEPASEWPGTRLLSGTALKYEYHASDFLSAILKDCATSLFEWQQPELPEDPCFLAADGRIILATIAHERDAFMDLRLSEVDSLQREAPSLELSGDDAR